MQAVASNQSKRMFVTRRQSVMRNKANPVIRQMRQFLDDGGVEVDRTSMEAVLA